MQRLTGIRKPVLVSALLSLALPVVSACQVPSDTEIIDGILQRVDEMEGEMTIVTKDGETVTIKITKESSLAGDSTEVGSEVKVETDKSNIVKKETATNKDTDRLPEDILPPLDSVKDVFGMLGLREKAVALHERGLTWSHIADEFGFNEDSMYAQLKEKAVVKLEHASVEGWIDRETYEKLLVGYLEKATKWIKEIFSDTGVSSVTVVDINTILPQLTSFEDVFKALGVWEKAAALREKGLTWSHIARELGFGPDSMHIHLRETADGMLERAYKAELITKEQWERMFNEFDELALKWIHEIFSDENSTDTVSDNDSSNVVSIEPVVVLPEMDSIESLFRMLDTWEKAVDLREQGLTWAQVARELGYTDDSMLVSLKEIAGSLLEFAVNNGLITKDQYERELQEFVEVAQKWVREVFGGDVITDTASLSNADAPSAD